MNSACKCLCSILVVEIYEDFSARSKYLGHASVITSHRKLYLECKYHACHRCLLLAPRSSCYPWSEIRRITSLIQWLYETHFSYYPYQPWLFGRPNSNSSTMMWNSLSDVSNKGGYGAFNLSLENLTAKLRIISAISSMKIGQFRQFRHLSLLFGTQLVWSNHQWWPSSATHLSGTMGQWCYCQGMQCKVNRESGSILVGLRAPSIFPHGRLQLCRLWRAF